MKLCIHGDVILAQVMGADRKGRREARVVRVTEPKTGQIVGRYFTEEGMGFVVPDDSRLCFDILIPKESINGARMGNIVVAELTRRPGKRVQALGVITEVLGELAYMLVKDGEGATKVMHIHVTGAACDADAEKVARTIGHSQLVKTW